MKAVVPVQVQTVAVSEIAPVPVIRRVLRHWGLLLLLESGLVSSREKGAKKNIPCVFVQLPLNNKAEDGPCFTVQNEACCCVKLKLRVPLTQVKHVFSIHLTELVL